VNPVGKIPMDSVRGRGWFPNGGGQVSYTDLWGRAVLSARRTIAPNLYLAQNTVNDGITAQVAMPLPWLVEPGQAPKLNALGTIGVDRQQLIDSNTADLEGKFYTFRADVSVAWMPHPNQTYAVRYEFAYQSGDSAAMVLIPKFVRNTLYFTFSLRYPDRVAGVVPMPPKYRRVDGTDSALPGGEPVIPEGYDPHAPSGGGGGDE
jgi:hypothetical protein